MSEHEKYSIHISIDKFRQLLTLNSYLSENLQLSYFLVPLIAPPDNTLSFKNCV